MVLWKRIVVLLTPLALGLSAVGISNLSDVSAEQDANQSRIVPLPQVDLSDPNYARYTLNDRDGPDAPLRSLTLKLPKHVTVAMGGVGMVENGMLKSTEKVPHKDKKTFTITLSVGGKSRSQNILSEFRIYNLYISSTYGRELVYKGVQANLSKYCRLEPDRYGLFRVFDADPNDSFKSCDAGTGKRLISNDSFSSNDLIRCIKTGEGICRHTSHFETWQIVMIYSESDLPRWRELKAAVQEFLVHSSSQQ